MKTKGSRKAEKSRTEKKLGGCDKVNTFEDLKEEK